MSPACRTPNAAIPPIRPRQPRPTDPAAGGNVDPHTTAHPPAHARPTRPPTPDHTQPQRAPTNRNLARPARPGPLPAQPPLTGPLNGGFCTIRRTATACRRRVAPLMLQFPPFARAETTAAPTSAPPSALAGTSDAPPRPAAAPPAQRLHSPATASGQSVARHHQRKLRTSPTIQPKRNQTDSIRSNCHKLILNALEFIHEPRRWGHRSPLHPRNC